MCAANCAAEMSVPLCVFVCVLKHRHQLDGKQPGGVLPLLNGVCNGRIQQMMVSRVYAIFTDVSAVLFVLMLLNLFLHSSRTLILTDQPLHLGIQNSEDP